MLFETEINQLTEPQLKSALHWLAGRVNTRDIRTSLDLAKKQ